MRIAFVAANRERLPDPVIPLGLLGLHAACPEGHETRVLDLCFERSPEDALTRLLEDLRPELVALSLRNLQSADYADARANIAYYGRLMERVRNAGDPPVVLGGPGFSVAPARLMERLGAHYGVAGEGEWIFPRLVEALAAGDTEPALPGLFTRADGVVRRPSSPAPFFDLSRLQHGDRRLVDPRHYERCGIDAVQTRRGCSLGCTYCTYPMIEGRRVRLRPAAQVADELAHVREAVPMANHFFVVDSAFNRPKQHAMAVCDAIVERDIGLPWTAYVNPAGFDAELAERMAAAGCVGMELGSDSGHDATLARLHKGFDTADILAAQAAARDAGLLDCHTFLFGAPGERPEEVEESLAFIDRLDPAAAILMIYHDDGDSLRAEGARREVSERVAERIARALPSHPRWVVPPLGHRFDARRFGLLRRHGLTGPLWQHLPRSDGSSLLGAHLEQAE